MTKIIPCQKRVTSKIQARQKQTQKHIQHKGAVRWSHDLRQSCVKAWRAVAP